MGLDFAASPLDCPVGAGSWKTALLTFPTPRIVQPWAHRNAASRGQATPPARAATHHGSHLDERACRSFPSQDAFTDRPFAPGAVLIGDAAGYNDPITGQGLSIVLRDVRMVRDALLGTSDWNGSALFEPYAEERRKRMRRLRFVARFVAELYAKFGDEMRRKRALKRIRAEPPPILASVYVGPERIDGALFSEEFFQSTLAPGRGSPGPVL